jgi:anti-anti-sigma factor
MTTELKVDREVDGEVTVLGLVGELDLAKVAVADAELQAAQQSARVVLLDLSRLEFMDSSGVQLILKADARARDRGGRLAVLAGSGLPLRVLTALGLTGRLDLVVERAEVTG